MALSRLKKNLDCAATRIDQDDDADMSERSSLDEDDDNNYDDNEGSRPMVTPPESDEMSQKVDVT
jgi:hypothetical protein